MNASGRRSKAVKSGRSQRRKRSTGGQLVARSMRRELRSVVRRSKSLPIKRRQLTHRKSKRQLLKKAPKRKIRKASVLTLEATSADLTSCRGPATATRSKDVCVSATSDTPPEPGNVDAKDKKREKRRKQLNKLTAQTSCVLSPGPSRLTLRDLKEDSKRSSGRGGLKSVHKKTPTLSPAFSYGTPSSSKDSCLEEPDWPSLNDAYRRKGLIKEAATEIVKNKQRGSVKRISRQRWADIAASRSKEKATTFPVLSTVSQAGCSLSNLSNRGSWAAIAASSHGQHSDSVHDASKSAPKRCILVDVKSEPAKKLPSKESPGGSGRKKKQSACEEKATGSIGKVRDKSQSLRRQVKDDKQSVVKKQSQRTRQRRNRPTAIYGGLVSNSVPGKAALIPETSTAEQEDLCQKKEATSRDNNGRQAWRIDNMPVVYTKPASSVISLNEPIQAQKVHDKGNKNRCNNRIFNLSDFITSTAEQKKGSKNSKSRKTSGLSGTDICTLLSTISFHSDISSEDDEYRGSEEKAKRSSTCMGGSCSVSPPGQRVKKPPTKPSPNKANKEDNETKKVSLKYRALLRGNASRLDVKAVSEIHTRNKRAGAILEEKTVTRDIVRLQRQERQQRAHNKQRSSVMTSDANDDDEERAVDPSQVQGTSKSFSTNTSSSEKKKRQTTKSSPKGRRKGDSSSDSRDANNSFDYIVKHTRFPSMSPEPSNVSSGTSISPPLGFRSEPDLFVESSQSLHRIQPVPSQCLDLNWWCSYLFHEVDTTTTPDEWSSNSSSNNSICITRNNNNTKSICSAN